jgi:uncharacterized protein
VRRSGRFALLAAGLLAAPALAAAGVPGMVGTDGAPSPVRTQPLAPGEMLLEAGGLGVVTSRADLATILVLVSGSGDTPAAARRANAAEVRRVVAAARRAGAPADGIDIRDGETPNAFVTMLDPGQTRDGSTAAHRTVSTITIRLRDIARVDAVRAALEAVPAANVALPVYALTDRTAARREARAQALAAARADAEAHAQNVGMRLARMVRITERVSNDLYGLALNNAAQFARLERTVGPARDQTKPQIVTLVMLGVDYALAPR